MGYSEEYDKLFSPSGFNKMKQLLDDNKIINIYSHSDFKINKFEGEKYYSLTINTDENPATFAAFLYVVYLDIEDIRSLVSSELNVFPFMMIVFPSTIEPCASKYFNPENTLKHELSHLKFLKEHFDLNPDFITRGMKFSLTNLQQAHNISIDEIRECVKYEVEKIFLIEPQAMKMDYENGETVIPIPFLFNVVEYKCDSSLNYIQMQLHNYLSKIKSDARKLKKDSSDHYRVVDKAFNDSLKRFGKDIFGEEADRAFEEFDKNWINNVLDRVIN